MGENGASHEIAAFAYAITYLWLNGFENTTLQQAIELFSAADVASLKAYARKTGIMDGLSEMIELVALDGFSVFSESDIESIRLAIQKKFAKGGNSET